jgi:hypothetical protein
MTFRMLRLIALSCVALTCCLTGASAQEYAPVGGLTSCTSGNGINWTAGYCWTQLTTNNETITLGATATCLENGQEVEGNQYAFAYQCKNYYGLYIKAYTENETTEENCELNTIGDITVEAQLKLVGVVIATTYSGEECPNATLFESAPGVFIEGPNC